MSVKILQGFRRVFGIANNGSKIVGIKNNWNVDKCWCVLTNGKILIFNLTFSEFVGKGNCFSC